MTRLLIANPALAALLRLTFGSSLGLAGATALRSLERLILIPLSLTLGLQAALYNDQMASTLATFAYGDLGRSYGRSLDQVSAAMAPLVVRVSAVVLRYALDYMHHDPHTTRFVAYRLMFLAAMLRFTLAGDLLRLFLGWELVGLVSFRLINY
jgi:NADH-quinone oxidoreductase subunit L